MEIITGYTGKKHVTSEQDRDINIGLVGEGSFVLCTGMQMEAEVSTNNEIKIRDGVIIHQGCAASIKKNTYDSVMIINGSQGMKRIDRIVARYQRDKNTNVESLDFVVIQGNPTESEPAAPEYVTGDIQAGDYMADMPMYQVVIDGLNIVEVKKEFEMAIDLEAAKKQFSILSDNMGGMKYKVYDIPPNTRSWSKGNNSAMVIDIDYAKIKSISAALYTATTLYALPIPAMSNEGAYNIAFAVSVRLSNSGTLTLSCGGEWSKYGLHVVVGYAD